MFLVILELSEHTLVVPVVVVCLTQAPGESTQILEKDIQIPFVCCTLAVSDVQIGNAKS